MDYNGKVLGAGSTLAVTGLINVWIGIAVGVILIAIAVGVRYGWRKDKTIDQ